MMGRYEHRQGHLFYKFDLEEMVPADHLLRGIGHILDLSGLRQHLAAFYSHTTLQSWRVFQLYWPEFGHSFWTLPFALTAFPTSLEWHV
jgi:hypothetical protein